MATSTKYVIRATPKVLERAYYALDRVKRNASLTAQAVNREISAKFGAPLPNALWTVLNAARKDGALERVVMKSFSFSEHGRDARLGKSAAARAGTNGQAEVDRRETGGRRGADEVTRLKPDTGKHPLYLIASLSGGKREFMPCKNRKAAERTLRKLIRDGAALGDIAIYTAEPLAVRLGVLR